ncbi:MAG: YceD family protein [Xenococcaceae cyanobacterium]
MRAIFIPQLLKTPQKKQEIEVADFITGLSTLTPVRGWIEIKHCGTYLEVSAKAEAIVTLTCDRCLKQYNHKLSLNTSEMIWLEEESDSASLPKEREIEVEDLSENLPPDGYFEPESWLYEHLSLTMPIRQICGTDCQGVEQKTTKSESNLDMRWATLEVLKQQLENRSTENGGKHK